MVRYYGRARQRVGSVNTNQPGLKQAGCPTTVGKQGKIVRFLGRRVNCNMKTCGLPMSGLRCQYGVADAIGRNKTYDEIEQSNNPAIKNYCRQVINHYKGQFCQWPQPRTRQNAGGVGHIWTPRRNHCEKTCSLGWDEIYMIKHDSGIPTFPLPEPFVPSPPPQSPPVLATLFYFVRHVAGQEGTPPVRYAISFYGGDVSQNAAEAPDSVQQNSIGKFPLPLDHWSNNSEYVVTVVGAYPTLPQAAQFPWRAYLIASDSRMCRNEQAAIRNYAGAWCVSGSWVEEPSGASLGTQWAKVGVVDAAEGSGSRPAFGWRFNGAVASLSIPWAYAQNGAVGDGACYNKHQPTPPAWLFTAGGQVCCATETGSNGCLTNSVEVLDTSLNEWGGMAAVPRSQLRHVRLHGGLPWKLRHYVLIQLSKAAVHGHPR